MPVSGCVFNAGGRVAASFVSHGDEHTAHVDNLQMLEYNPATAGFKMSWQSYATATTKGSGWWAVRVMDTAPCVVTLDDGTEFLGKVQLSEERAAYGRDGKEVSITGPPVQAFLVLCRDSPVPGAKYD